MLKRGMVMYDALCAWCKFRQIEPRGWAATVRAAGFLYA